MGSSEREDLLFSAVGVAVACGSFDAGLRSDTADFCGVCVDGSGRSGISGRTGSAVCGDDSAVIQLSSAECAEASTGGVGVGCCKDELADVNKP